jgi:hypothetical protein
MLGLVAVAAVAVMAFVGAGTASAVTTLLKTTLCKENKNPCPASKEWALPQTIKAKLPTGKKAVLKAGVKDECSTSEVVLKATESLEHDIHGVIETVTFSNCTCTTSAAIHLPWTGLLTANGTGGGTLLASNSGSGNPGGLVICSGTHCTYEASDPTVTINGGNPAKAIANVALTLNESESDFLCIFSGTAHWEAEYEVTTQKPLFISLELLDGA